MPCTGNLPHALSFGSHVLRSLAMVPPSTEVIEIGHADGQVMIADISAPAERAESVEIKPMTVPAKQSMQMTLGF